MLHPESSKLFWSMWFGEVWTNLYSKMDSKVQVLAMYKRCQTLHMYFSVKHL